MKNKMKYYLSGDTYQIKDDLKAFGCKWDGVLNRWTTPEIFIDEVIYKKLKSLMQAIGGHIIPSQQTQQIRKIQDILN